MVQKWFKALLMLSVVMLVQDANANGCCKKKCKEYYSLVVKKLRVLCNANIGGNLTVGGDIIADDIFAGGNLTVGGTGSFGGDVSIGDCVLSCSATGLVITTTSGSTTITGDVAVSPGAMFFGLTAGTGNPGPTDYAATVAVKTAAGTGRVPFPQDGPTTGSIVRIDGSSFTLPAIGIYEVTFRVHTTEPGQLQLELNGADLANTVAVNMNPTSGGHPIIGNALISTSVVNSTLAVINPTGNSTALTITPADGAETHANAQSITIKQIA